MKSKPLVATDYIIPSADILEPLQIGVVT